MKNMQSDDQIRSENRSGNQPRREAGGGQSTDKPEASEIARTEIDRDKRDKTRIMWLLSSDLFPLLASAMRVELSNFYMAFQQMVSDEQREEVPEVDLYAARMDRSYFRMLRMVNNLTAAVYLRGQEEYDLQPWDIVETVGRICYNSEELAAWKHIRLKFQCDFSYHVVMIDRRSIEMALYHLLSNAMKNTPSGGVITVRLRQSGDQIALEVADTGHGMTGEQQKALFDLCVNWDRDRVTPGSFGLGLPLCCSVARGHGGTLQAASLLGRGCVMTLSVPDKVPSESACVMRQNQIAPEDDNGFNPTLLALSDAMPLDAFRLYHNHDQEREEDQD